MFTITDFAQKNKLSISNVLYYLKLNNLDFSENKYDVCLDHFINKIFIEITTQRRKHITKKLYRVKEILDSEKFEKEFFSYMNFLKKKKALKAQEANLSWTRSAIECFLSGNCKNCVNSYVCNTMTYKINGEYPMQKTVKKLLSICGKPNEIDMIKNFPQSMTINERLKYSVKKV